MTRTGVGSSAHARAAEEAGVAERVRFEIAGAEALPVEGYDLVCLFDAFHDLGDPAGAARHLRETLAPDGTLMLVEPQAGDRPEDNLNPVGRMFYAGSALICVPHAIADSDGQTPTPSTSRPDLTQFAGQSLRGGGNHYTGSYTDAAGTRRGKAGWECVHVAIDDATRLAYAEVLPDEKATTAIGFLRRAVVFFGRHGMTVQGTDHRQRRRPTSRPSTRSPAESWASVTCAPAHAGRRPTARPTASSARCSRPGLRRDYASSAKRTAALDGWLWRYNHNRRHSALGRQTPITRLNNLLGTYN